MRTSKLVTRLRHIFLGTGKRIVLTLVTIAVAMFVFTIGALYEYVVNGGLIARKTPPAFETFIAHHLLDMSIPNAATRKENPLIAHVSGADLVAGRNLYQKNCAACHGYDGSGRTAAGSGLYPRAADLRGPETLKRTDGDLFYLIRNGIRNTGMPGWQLPEQQTWQLVLFIRNLLPVVAANSPAPIGDTSKSGNLAQYVGSTACRSCHSVIYDRWKKTLMANVVRDPREHPDAIIPDLSKHDPLVTFSIDDVAFVYGSKWKQRYFKKIGNDYFPLPAQWDVTHKQWRPYHVKDDWWVPFYPPDNLQRPTGTTCDGCHSVNYDIADKTVTEWNVGCEKCHGPGSDHVKNPVADNIVNPSRLDYVQSNDACIQCHSQGRPISNPIEGKYYDWPVGFHVGKKLSGYWRMEGHRLGETSFTHFGDGTAHKNRMQGNDFVTSLMYTHGVACFTCHDAHGSENDGLLRKPANVLCLDCHGPNSPNGPFAATFEEHTHHKPGSAGGECIACHMPKIAQTLGDVNVRSHTFRFVGPAKTDAMKIPNACNVCHVDKTSAWTAETLSSWSDRSPWRMAD